MMRARDGIQPRRRWKPTIYVLEVAQFAKERASSDNRKAYPNTPDDATQNRDDLMAEELPRLIVSGRGSGPNK